MEERRRNEGHTPGRRTEVGGCARHIVGWACDCGEEIGDSDLWRCPACGTRWRREWDPVGPSSPRRSPDEDDPVAQAIQDAHEVTALLASTQSSECGEDADAQLRAVRRALDCAARLRLLLSLSSSRIREARAAQTSAWLRMRDAEQVYLERGGEAPVVERRCWDAACQASTALKKGHESIVLAMAGLMTALPAQPVRGGRDAMNRTSYEQQYRHCRQAADEALREGDLQAHDAWRAAAIRWLQLEKRERDGLPAEDETTTTSCWSTGAGARDERG